MTTPANYATLIAEIDVVIESYGLSLQEVFGGRSTQPTLQELIDLRYELGVSDPSQITSTSKPTTRADGSALQQGDRWYNPSTGIDGFWNGTYWLSSFILSCSALGRDAGYNGGSGTNSAAIDNSSPIFVFKATVTYSVTVDQDSDNYWNINTNTQGASASTSLTATVNTQGQSALANNTLRVSKDLPVPINYWAANTINNFFLGFGAVGTAGTIYLGATIYWRQVL